MRIIVNFILLILAFHHYSFKEVEFSKTSNWDDAFLSCFNPLDINLEAAAAMVAICIATPKTFDEIDNLCDAIRHYKANKDGNSVPATENLIEHMKDYNNCFLKFTGRKFYKDVKKELKKIITEKIKKSKKDNGNKGTDIIKNAEPSSRGAWYLTLGSYNMDIKYSQKVDLSKTKFTFTVEFQGEDLWDFAPKDCSDKTNLSKFACLIDNLFEEKFPDLIIGDGTEYKVSYTFSDTIDIDTNDIFLAEVEDECKVDNSEYLLNNLLFILFLCLFLN
jgi:hypothetical protein